MGSAQTKSSAAEYRASSMESPACSIATLKRVSLSETDLTQYALSADKKTVFRADDPQVVQADWKMLHLIEMEKNADSQLTQKYASACSEANFCKNRYSSVLALERTRVQVASGSSDYINANFVDGIHQDSKKAYIAAQAPIPDTFSDFWHMVWEQNVHIIVMLTRLCEGGRVKADRYWPTRRPKRFGDIVVRLDKIETTLMGYKIKQFQVERPNQLPRTVYQYHFLDWPDHGVPADPSHLLHMMQRIDDHSKQLEEQDSEELMTSTSSSGSETPSAEEEDVVDHFGHGRVRSPLLIHCSAGIGRTGAFMVIHTALHKLLEEGKETNDVDMKALVASIRDQRAGVLTGLCQYSFCIDAVKQGLSSLNAVCNTASSTQQEKDRCSSLKCHAEQLTAKLKALRAFECQPESNGLDEDDEPSDCESDDLAAVVGKGECWVDNDGVLCDPVSKQPLYVSSPWYTLASSASPCGSPPTENSIPIPSANDISGSRSASSLENSVCWWSAPSPSNSTSCSWYTTEGCRTPLSSSQ